MVSGSSFEAGGGRWKATCPCNTAQPYLGGPFTCWVALAAFPRSHRLSVAHWSSSASFQLPFKASSREPTVWSWASLKQLRPLCAPSAATREKWNQPISSLTPSVASQGVFGLLVSWHNNPPGLICTSLSHLYQLFIFHHFDISRTSISSQF